MNDVQFWSLIVAVLAAVGGLMAAVFAMGRFTGRMERGLLAIGESVAGLESKVDATAAAAVRAHEALGAKVDVLDERLARHLQASIPQAATGD